MTRQLFKIMTFVLLGVLTAQHARAQKSVVSGTVVSATTGKPVVGASVTADGVAVVTNADGFFTLKTDVEPEAVVVSCLGYRSRQLSPADYAAGGNLLVKLPPTTIQLREVVVTADNPRELVNAAIAKIPDNYSQQPEVYNCFYRETAMKRQHYICVAEGVVDMYKTPYGRGVSRDRVAIRKGRRLFSPRRGDTLSVKVLGGPVTPVQLDVVKNNGFLLNAEELDFYDMKMEVPTSINSRQQYVISISPRRVMPYALYHGTLYIDQQTLAFTRIELSLDMSDRDKATQVMLVRKPMGVRFRPKELSLLVDYRYDGVLSRISYLRTTFRFNCDWRRRLFATSFTAFCEMAVTSTNSHDAQPIHGRESFDQRDAFFDKVDYFRDPAFWEQYNIIEPTVTLDKAIEKLTR